MPAQVTVYEDAPITSIAMSPDGRHLLANLSSHIIHLWALQPFLDRLAAQAANPTGALAPAPPTSLLSASATSAPSQLEPARAAQLLQAGGLHRCGCPVCHAIVHEMADGKHTTFHTLGPLCC